VKKLRKRKEGQVQGKKRVRPLAISDETHGLEASSTHPFHFSSYARAVATHLSSFVIVLSKRLMVNK
jgi:hypothetical protein